MQTQDSTVAHDPKYDPKVVNRIREYLLGERAMLVCPNVQFQALHASQEKRSDLEVALANEGYFCAGTERDNSRMREHAASHPNKSIVVNYSNFQIDRVLYVKNEKFRPARKKFSFLEYFRRIASIF